MIRHNALRHGWPARIGLLAAAALTVPALAGCGLAKQPTPTLPQLRAEPVTVVQYPSSELVSTDGADSNNDFGPNSAFLDRTWVTKDSPAAIFAYFDAKLSSLGWTRDDSAGTSNTSWSHMQAWTNGKRTYQVAIDTTEQDALVIKFHPTVPVGDTVFETVQE